MTFFEVTGLDGIKRLINPKSVEGIGVENVYIEGEIFNIHELDFGEDK